MKIAVLFSGGKDSCRTVYWCLKNKYDVKYLVTMIPKKEDSWMFHFPNIRLTELSAEAIGLPFVSKETFGIKEKEVEDMKKVLKVLDIDAVACGGIFSNYQKSRIERVCNELNLKFLAPFWHSNPEKFLEETIDLGLEVVIVGVYAEGFDKSWLGRKLDYKMLEELKKLHEKYKINLVFEGGEAETLVLDGPIFKKKIEILDSNIVWEGFGGYLNIKKAILVDKF